ncbi:MULTISPECIES: SLC13 family permease [unclassified Microbacterium]|uniref:SLC13 family permease n=1 Tax=unclassified Microbacterium TaxID=2609290 RepID=UPI000EA93649|nr:MULTISPECIES: SLC13 family permease [unclassified Microbacterium]MBT2486202.1 SLC13/DASS family transporter [Microbacterium sp. ISL-108]RKN68924.1 SLC13/DASS family transporter [Microbacterium sp. CGR2]
MNPEIITFIILGAAVIAFVSNRIPMVIVAMAVPIALWATGVLTLGESFAGFGDPIVLFIVALFIVSEALDATGVTSWVGQQLMRRAGKGRSRLLLIVCLLAAVLSAIISINGAVAALLPIVVLVAVRAGIVPSKMLLPLAFAAGAGSLLTLTGTPVNILVSQAAAEAGGRPFGYFEFAIVGIPMVVLTVTLVIALGDRLLPERVPDRLAEPADPSHDAKAWRETYDVPLDTGRLFTVGEGVAEVLIAPRSSLIGRSVSPGMTTRQEDLVILALRHSSGPGDVGRKANRAVTLQAGDAVLVQGPWEALHRYTSSPDVIPVSSPRQTQRTVPLGRGARRALVILGVMVVLLATGIVPPVIAGLLAAGALILTRVLTVSQTFSAISWPTVTLIAGMIPLSSAFVSTGAADLVGDAVLQLVGDTSPYLALLTICVASVVLGQFISNVATVLVIAPIAVSVASSMDVSVQPFMMALTVVGAAAFLTPIATPVNLMVMQPAGYRFGDYWRLGVPLALVYIAVAVLYVPLIWPF